MPICTYSGFPKGREADHLPRKEAVGASSVWGVLVRYDGMAKAREGNYPPNPNPHNDCYHSDKAVSHVEDQIPPYRIANSQKYENALQRFIHITAPHLKRAWIC